MSKKEEFVAIFKAEAAEHVTRLEGGLVELEKDPGNVELVKELNMVAHTLKGSARVFEFKQIQEIAHRMEDIFDKVTQKKLGFSSFIADRIFKGLDKIKVVLERIPQEENVEIDVSQVCRDLEECSGGARAKDKPVSTADAPTQTQGTVPEAHAASGVDEYIRVPVSRVNKLLALSGEMVINKMKTTAKVSQFKKLARLAKEVQYLVSSLSETIKKEPRYHSNEMEKLLAQCNVGMQKIKEEAVYLGDTISKESFHLDPIIDELQASMKELRMLPLSTIFEGFSRMVRDIASENAKMVNLEITGEQTELDKKVLEEIKDPLIHILRNCIDHGIEDPQTRSNLGKPQAGTIKLSACHEEGNVVIRVEDDGKGIDVEEIKQVALKKNFVSKNELEAMTDKEITNIVFMNGYSTSPLITDISGRGIGLDIVRRGMENLKGQVILDAEKGKGTKLTLSLPLTIAIMHVLLLKVEETSFAVPVASIIESIKINMKDVSTIEGRMAVQVRGHTLPLVRLKDALGLVSTTRDEENKGPDAREEAFVVIASSLDKQVGFIVDGIIGEEEVFIKSLGRHLGKVNNVGGATMLWTGEVVVILDVEDLVANSRFSHPAVTSRVPATKEKRKEKRILVVEDALSTRELEKSILEAEGYIVDAAVDGIDALDRAAQVKYDLIVTDIQMPRMDGFEFCENLKKNEAYKDTPVMIVTALSKEEDKRRGIEVGAAAYIIKTAFDQSTLLDAIERLIGV